MKNYSVNILVYTYLDWEDMPVTKTLLYAIDENGNYFAECEKNELPKLSKDVQIITNEELFTIGAIGFLNLKPIEPFETVYERVQHYGGAEEGGWYYHTLEATNLDKKDVEFGTNRYGEGYLLYKELVFGMHQDLERQYYS